MRRRIYIAPDGSGLGDITDRPYRYSVDLDDPPGALYDEPLWDAYLAAETAFRKLETAVIAHLRDEPFDDVERSAAASADALMNMPAGDPAYGSKMEELVSRMIAHAKSVHDADKAKASR